MKIKSFEGGFDKNLSYLIWCPKTKIAGIVDPSVNITPIVELIEIYNLKLEKIFITHTHHDHILYLDDFMYLFPNIEILCSDKNLKKFKYHITKLADYEIVTVGQEFIISIYSPGHYIDSVCFWNKKAKVLFTGDTIFVGRTGRTISQNSNVDDLYNSLYNKLLILPNDTTIYPGHNYGFTKSITISDNIQYSNFFTCKTLEEFKLVMQRFESNRKK